MRFCFALIAIAGLLSAAEVKLGKPLTLKAPVAVAAVLAHPGDYIGKTVQVKGKIVEVCEMMGCWMDLSNDEGQRIRVQVKDGEIEFPKDSPGKMAVAEGKLDKLELTRDQAVARAEEEAKEAGRKFNPDSIKGGMTIYQIQGTGAVLLSN